MFLNAIKIKMFKTVEEDDNWVKVIYYIAEIKYEMSSVLILGHYSRQMLSFTNGL